MLVQNTTDVHTKGYGCKYERLRMLVRKATGVYNMKCYWCTYESVAVGVEADILFLQTALLTLQLLHPLSQEIPLCNQHM